MTTKNPKDERLAECAKWLESKGKKPTGTNWPKGIVPIGLTGSVEGTPAYLGEYMTIPGRAEEAERDKYRNEVKQETEPVETIPEAIKRLSSLHPLEYEKVREKESDRLNVRVTILDREIIKARNVKQTDNDLFNDPEPYPEPVNPAQLIGDISTTIRRFIVLDKHQADAAALWVTACWFVDEIPAAPIALINAPEKSCGKTQLLTVLKKLAPRGEQLAGISPSALYRVIEKYKPTLFIDEIETVLKDNEDLRGLLNAGHTRDSASVIRCAGDDNDPKRFSVWGMKAIAGINAIKLAETVTSRSIIFELRRKKPGEGITRLRHAEPGLFETLQSKLARFAADYSGKVGKLKPFMPNDMGDRDQNNVEPLLQVAQVAGGHWPQTALNAALIMCKSTDSHHSVTTELLSDIQEIFETKGILKISTADLIKELVSDDEKSWQTYNRGNQLTPRQLATKLKPYGILSKTIRLGYETAKGYDLDQFRDTFDRYLVTQPPFYPSQGNNSLKANNHADSRVADSFTDKTAIGNNVTNIPDSELFKHFSPHPLYELRKRVKAMASVTDSENVTDCYRNKKLNVTPKPAPALDCDVVTDKTPPRVKV